MIEGQLLVAEVGRRRGRLIQQIAPEQGVGGERLAILAIEVRQIDHPLYRGKLRQDFLHLGLAVERLAAVLVAIDAEQYLRRELCIAIEDAAGTEVRSTAGPDRTD